MPIIGFEKKTKERRDDKNSFVSGVTTNQSNDTFQLSDTLSVYDSFESNTNAPSIKGELSKQYESNTY